MAQISGPPSGVTRNKPIQHRLQVILSDAADAAGIDHVRISSGGQDAKGHGTRRTGSIRHDLGGAADLELLIQGHVLNFQNMTDRAIIAKFVTECSRRGATGIGAGVDYMGPTKLHVGFGSKATWGGPNARSADAPAWLVAAVAAASGGASPPASSSRSLRLGDEGERVTGLQAALNRNGANLVTDGKFGQGTKAALEHYQRVNMLLVDGIAGDKTLTKLGL